MHNYETIDISQYVRSGEGGTAVTYKHKTLDTMAKLYNPGFEADRAAAEFTTARTVFEMGVETPEPLRLVTDGQRFGAEYEFIPGKRSFARIISQEPGRLEEISLEFARQARRLHSIPADTTRLHSYRQAIRSFYLGKGDLVPEEYRQRAMNFLESVPDKPACVHGDLQIGNIITDGRRTLWIDTGEFGYGVPEWDLSMMWTICHNNSREKMENLFHLSPETLGAHWDIFLPAYLGTNDPAAIGQYTKSLLPYYAVKLPYVYDMAFHVRLPEAGIQRGLAMLG